MKHYALSCLTALALSLSAPSFADDKAPTFNINTASIEQITELKGIGPKKAEAIVAERDAHGPFKNADDLTRVKGIGEATADTLGARLSFQ